MSLARPFKLIGVTGPAGCGKDTVGYHLCAAHDFDCYAFAGPIKEMLRILGVDADTRETKELPHPMFGVCPRSMAQTLGTDWMRKKVCKDGWLRLAAEYLDNARGSDCLRGGVWKPYAGLVLTDVRFENEAEFIRKHGGTIIHLRRPDLAPVAEHEAERGVKWDAADYMVENNGSFEQLYAKIDNIVKFTRSIP